MPINPTFDGIDALNPTPSPLLDTADKVPFFNTADGNPYSATLGQLQAFVLNAGTVDPTFDDVTANTVNATTITENGSAVVVATDIGASPNEIPLNQNLGTMAYQSAVFINVDQMKRSYMVLANNTAAQELGTNFATQVGIDADTTLTTTVPPAGTNAVVVIVTVGTVSRTVTFGTGFASTGTLATGTAADRRFVVNFLSDGTRLIEVSRTTAITV